MSIDFCKCERKNGLEGGGGGLSTSPAEGYLDHEGPKADQINHSECFAFLGTSSQQMNWPVSKATIAGCTTQMPFLLLITPDEGE